MLTVEERDHALTTVEESFDASGGSEDLSAMATVDIVGSKSNVRESLSLPHQIAQGTYIFVQTAKKATPND